MATRRKVKAQIRLVAFVQNNDSSRSVQDIIDTDFHYAYGFVRRWLQDSDIVAIGIQHIDSNGYALTPQISIRELR